MSKYNYHLTGQNSDFAKIMAKIAHYQPHSVYELQMPDLPMRWRRPIYCQILPLRILYPHQLVMSMLLLTQSNPKLIHENCMFNHLLPQDSTLPIHKALLCPKLLPIPLWSQRLSHSIELLLLLKLCISRSNWVWVTILKMAALGVMMAWARTSMTEWQWVSLS